MNDQPPETVMDLNTASQAWWNATKNNPDALMAWLRKQYHGEATAAERIRRFSAAQGVAGKAARTLEVIASQEDTHAAWVGDLLRARGEEPVVLKKDERYWDETLGQIEDLESGAAVAAHAEHMRLARIRVIAADEDAPEDIRNVFAKILPEEEFHERAFTSMSTPMDMEATRAAHERGLEALGLITVAEVL